MLSKISLLPLEYKKKNRLKKQMYFIITVTIGIAIFLSLMVTFIIGYRLTLTRELDNVVEQKQKVQAQIEELKQYELLQAQTKDAQALLDSMIIGNINWGKFLEVFSNSMPAGISIEAFTTSKEGSSTSLTFNATALNSKAIKVWIDNLESTPGINNVKTTFTTPQDVGSNTYYKFDISLEIKPSSRDEKTMTFKEVSTK